MIPAFGDLWHFRAEIGGRMLAPRQSEPRSQLGVSSMIEVATSALAAQLFLRGMQPRHLDALAAVAADVRFPAGYRIFEDGGHANRFWLIRSGRIALDLNVPGEGLLAIENIGLGGLLGCSWQFPPYQWAFGAVTISPCEAFEFDAPAVRAACVADPLLGYEITQRLVRVLAGRLQATRMRLLAPAVRAAGPYS
jgi:CRP/FNR family transcriptional regulator, cyclic AMP receptor protein